MKRIIRGVIPPAKKMAKRLSGDSTGKLEGDGSCSAIKVGKEDVVSGNTIDFQEHPTSDRAKANSSDQPNLDQQSERDLMKDGLNSMDISMKQCKESVNSSTAKNLLSDLKYAVETSSHVINQVEPGKQHQNILQLPSPVKSENDKKEYKVIKLPNGLTALLISDVRNIVELDPKDCTLETEEKMEEAEAEPSLGHESEEEESDIDSAESCGSGDEMEDGTVKKPPMTEEKLAAVALTVGVGSFSDPDDIPGLAHFLEHMVFMGSEKFPQENDFDEYVKKEGGFDNACTYCETTSFYFECHEKGLLRTIDRFAQFFISPLMKREAMTREREAIESEFQMSVTSDDDRKSQLFSSMAVEKHPATKFTWGNLKTLRDNVTDDQLYKAVHDFRNRHYSAHRMTLAVQARLPLDLLEKWVVECFSAIPNNKLPPEDFSPFRGPAFDPDKFCKFYMVNPVRDMCHIDITWFLPPLMHLYRKKPLEYISWCLGHEGHGSLLSHLRKKVWALEIISDRGYDFENNSLYRLYSLCIVLTKEGINHLPEVIEAVFAYVKLLQCKGPQEALFKEIQSIEEANFRFVEEIAASEYVENLSENMHKYPPEDYICGDELYFEYDPDEIRNCLKEFRLDNVNLMVSTKTPREGVTFDQTEPWFGTQYHVEPIPKDWIDKWSKVEPYPDFALPEKNPFITTDFSILPEEPDTRDQPYPVKLVESDSLELWYRRDYKFLVPNSFLYAFFISPVLPESPQTCSMMDIFIEYLNHQTMEDLYPARMAGLEYELSSKQRGLTVRCWGFNQKVPMLMETLIRGIRSFNDKLDEQMFAAVKDKLQKYYFNFLLKPENVSSDVRASIIQQRYWTTVEKYEAIKQVTPEMLRAFVTRYFERLYVQFLAQGNISKEEAMRISHKVVEIIGSKPLPLADIPHKRVVQVPIGERVCRVESFNKDDTNCVTTNYYQSGLGCIKDYSTIEMIIMLMEEPLFNILRTQEQLGYSVYCLSTDTYGKLILFLTKKKIGCLEIV